MLRSAVGLDTGIDVDRVVPDVGRRRRRRAGAGVPRRAGASGARVEVVDHGATTYDLKVRSDGAPFWLVLGESHSSGWKAEVSGSEGWRRVARRAARSSTATRTAGSSIPAARGRSRSVLRWTGQNLVWVAFALSLLAIGACLAVVVRDAAAAAAGHRGDPELGTPFGYDAGVVPWRGVDRAAAVAGVGCVAGVAPVDRPGRRGGHAGGEPHPRRRASSLSGGAPAALLLAEATDTPELAWLAALLLAADLLTGCVSHLGRRRRGTQVSDEAPT